MNLHKWGEIALVSLITTAIIFRVAAIRGPIVGM